MSRFKRISMMQILAVAAVLLGVVSCLFLFLLREHQPASVTGKGRVQSSAPSSGSADEPFVVPAGTPRHAAETAVTVYVSGTVKDTEGNPIPEALVSLSFEGITLFHPFSTQGLSDDQGEFRLPVPQCNARYSINARKDGYLCIQVEKDGEALSSTFPVGTEDVSGLQCIMTVDSQIAGRVVDQFGRPIKDMMVFATVIGRDLTSGSDGRTGKDGRFRVRGLQSGTCGLWGRLYLSDTIMQHYGSAEYPLLTTELHEGEHKQNVELILHRDASRAVHGRVVDENRVAISGAQVWATLDLRNITIGAAPSTSSATGEFAIENIDLTTGKGPREEEIQDVVLNVTCTGYEPRTITGIPVGMKDIEIVLLREAYGNVYVELVDEITNIPIEQGSVYYLGSYSRFNEVIKNKSQPVKLKRDGAGFICENIPEGTAVLEAVADGYPPVIKTDVVVHAAKTTSATIALNPQGYLCVDIVKPTQNKDTWTMHVVNTFFVPVSSLGERRDFQAAVPQDPRRPSVCDGEALEGHKYDGMVGPAGEYILSLSAGVFDQTQEKVGIDGMVVWYCNTRLQLEPGAITDFTFDCDDLMGQPLVTVDLSGLTVAPSSKLVLVSGEYNGFLEQSRREMRAGRYLVDFYCELNPHYAEKCVFPFVPRGNYTLLYFEHFGDLGCSKPESKRVSISASEVVELSF
ncbi:MAG: carboxypeptidase regulatory-like domain-containing protein [Candidatus Hydrogenedens sp.]|nr:carboxypeptidase regulatory-like domain-containing protein [Candidatus Hydrogenedens sp.]